MFDRIQPYSLPSYSHGALNTVHTTPNSPPSVGALLRRLFSIADEFDPRTKKLLNLFTPEEEGDVASAVPRGRGTVSRSGAAVRRGLFSFLACCSELSRRDRRTAISF